MKVEITDVNGNELTVKVIGDVDVTSFEQNAYKGRYFGYLDPWLKGSSTDLQRKHYWALINDIQEHTGDSKGIISLRMKALYMITKDTDKEPSVAVGKTKKEDVQEWLQIIIEWCIENEIPFHHPEGYIPADESRLNFKLVMNKLCTVCGRPQSDLAHFGAVGMGRNRKTIDHTQSKFLTLCRKHHSEQHNIGEKSFLDKYKLTPINLSAENLKQLGV